MVLYIDPGTGGVIVNFLIAIITSIVYFFRKLFFDKINFDLLKKSEISIFSEGNQYKNTFFPIVNELIDRRIHFNYYTLDYKDDILEIESEFINSKFLGLGFLGKLKFSSISSNLLVSTTPNIGNKGFPLKRPKKVKELVHVWHSISDISYYKKGSLDNYDTILTVGDFQNKSIIEIENLKKLKAKKLVPVGLPYFDDFGPEIINNERDCKTVLIGSSWGDKGLLKKYGTQIIDALTGFDIIIRPHPQSYISEKKIIEFIKEKYKKNKKIKWDDNKSPITSMKESDILISDTSSIRFDFSFLTKKPVITIKIGNDNFVEYEADYLSSKWDDSVEHKIGKVIYKDDIPDIEKIIVSLSNKFDKSEIDNLKKETIFYENKSSKKIVDYLNNEK
jgi:hypothetical protein